MTARNPIRSTSRSASTHDVRAGRVEAGASGPRLAAAAAVVAIALLSSAATGRWMVEGGWFGRPPAADATGHWIAAAEMARGARRDGVRGFASVFAEFDGYHPPLMAAVAAGVALVLGEEPEAFHCWAATQLFALLWCAGAYRVARLGLGRGLSVAATALGVLAPSVAANLRPFYPQLPAAALVLHAWAALARSDGLARTRRAAEFGAWAGAAVLAKSLAPLYVAGGCVAAVALGFRAGRGRPALRGAAVALAVGGGAASTWYLGHWRTALAWASSVTGDAGQAMWSQSLPKCSVDRWLYYPFAFVNEVATAPVAAVVLATVLLSRRARARAAPVAPTIAASALLAYPALTLGQTAGYGYYVFVFAPPFFAYGLRIAAAAAAGAPRLGRAAIIASWIAAAAWAAFVAYRPSGDDAEFGRYGPIVLAPRAATMLTRWSDAYGLGRPGKLPEVWPNRRFVEGALRAAPRRTPFVAESVWQPFLGFRLFEAEARRLDRRFASWCLDPAFPQPADLVAALRIVDFLLVTDPVSATTGLRLTAGPSVAETLHVLGQCGLAWDEIERATLPSGQDAVLLRIGPSGAAVGFLDAATARERGYLACDAEFDNGWRLAGYLPPDPTRPPSLRLLWSFAGATSDAVLRIGTERDGGDASPPVELHLPAACAAALPFLATTNPLPDAFDLRGPFRIVVSATDARAGRVGVFRTSLPRGPDGSPLVAARAPAPAAPGRTTRRSNR